MSMSKKDFEQLAEDIRRHITYNGNSNPTKDLIRVLASAFGDINPQFDRSRFFNACDYDAPYAPTFYQGDLTAALRQYRDANDRSPVFLTWGDAVKALAKMVEDAGGNPGEFIAFATANPIPDALNQARYFRGFLVPPTDQE